MNAEIQQIIQTFETKKTERELLLNHRKSLQKVLKAHRDRHEHAIQARALFQEVAENIQKRLEIHITRVVTSALCAVFDEPYRFIARFIKRRNKTECDLLFEKDGEEFKPIESSGGGALDIASIALRIAFWSLNRTASVMILDEPGKFVSSDLQHKVSKMFKMLSDKLGIQFIIVSHQPDMIDAADKVFHIKHGKVVGNG